MHTFAHWTRGALATGLLAAATSTMAIEISGTFSGLAFADPLPLGFEPPRPVSDYQGQRIEGSFLIRMPDPVYHQGEPNSAYYLNGNGGSLSLTFDILGERFAEFKGSLPGPQIPGEVPVIATFSGPTMQSLTFLTDFRPRYGGAAVTFEGGAGSLYDGIDPATFRLDPDALPTFSAYMSIPRQNMTLSVDAETVRYSVLSPVPEPETWWLFGVGAIVVGSRWRRRGLRGAPAA